ncbi:hypothetical protein Ae201684P_007606 [Aphanomyces euteiches]|nr:hypothetical protein Ae201684P_007606 [Aphanomyces euteiches]
MGHIESPMWTILYLCYHPTQLSEPSPLQATDLMTTPWCAQTVCDTRNGKPLPTKEVIQRTPDPVGNQKIDPNRS